jgi:hypothetical protein
MEWLVKITEKKDQRILVKFDPKSEEIKFIGQFKPNTKDLAFLDSTTERWVDFSEESYSMDIDLETIQELLYKTYKKMNERLEAYENIAKGFEIIKLIEMPEEE